MESREQTPAPPHEPASSDPAAEQAPGATEHQKRITGDPGFGEQQPRQPAADPDAVHATSAPPAAAQSGMPLPQDRAAAAAEAAEEGTDEEGDAAEPAEPAEPSGEPASPGEDGE